MQTKISIIKLNAERFKNQRLLIFISFSMPMQSLKQWVSQANKKGAALVVRGLVNNSFKETALKVIELLEGTDGRIQIDPNLFKKYNIQQVPAMVLVNDVGFDVVYGDVPLSEALNHLES